MNSISKFLEWGLMLLLFLLPLQTRWILHQGMLNGAPWEYGTWSVYGTEILLLFLVGIQKWCEYFLLRNSAVPAVAGPPTPSLLSRPQKSLWGLPQTSPRAKIFTPLFSLSVFLFAALLSIFWSLDKSIAFRAWLTLVEGIALFWLLTSTHISRDRMVYAFLAGMTFQAGLGIYQFVTQSTFASTVLGIALHDPSMLGTSVVETTTERWLRAYGALSHPNILGGYLVAAILLLIGTSIKNKIVSYALFTLFTTTLFFTFSRSAWLALGVGLMLFLVSWWRSISPKNKTAETLRAWFLIACVFFFLGFLFWSPFSTRILGNERLEVASNQEHITSLQDTLSIIRTYPLLGVGIGNATVALNQKYPTRNAWSIEPPHNIFVLIFLELGVFGLVLFFYLLFFLFKLRTTYYVLPTLLVLGLFDHYLWSLYAGVLLLCAICGLASSTTFEKASG